MAANTQEKEAGAPLPATAAEFAVYRKLVPLLDRPGAIFFNSGLQPPSNLIIANALNQYTYDTLHNPSPKPGWLATAREVRQLLGRYINADPDDIALTFDTTEAAGSFIRSLDLQPGDNIVVLDSEYPNLPYSWLPLREKGIDVRRVQTIPEAVRTGQVTAFGAETFRPYVDERTKAIGLSSIMFHSGQWNDVAAISAEYRPKGIHVFADLTQQVGFAEVDVKALGVSAAGFSFYKGLVCPRGLGALYVDREVVKEMVAPPIVGVNSVVNVRADMVATTDELVYYPTARRFEHQNLNFASAAAAKAWLTFYLDTIGPRKLQEHLYTLGDALRAKAKSLGIKVVGPEGREQHAPHLYILELLDPRWAGFLDREGAWAMQYRLGVRVSFHFYNNLEDVERLGAILEKGLAEGLWAVATP